MKPGTGAAVVHAEILGRDLFVEFDDGSSGLYSGAFLFEHLSSAKQIDPLLDEEEEEEDGVP